MTRHVFRLPDLGEGTVSSEIVAWRVKPGDVVTEDQPVVDMSTDKAVVEVPAPVAGRVVTLSGEPGDVIAVGAELIVFETEGAQTASATAVEPAESAVVSKRVMASPATRRRAREADVDLVTIEGTGPGGRIQRSDLEDVLARREATAPANDPRASAGTGRA
ncbi:MAG: biotin/lipoyl-containing protein, partial [Steroidobacteraceae bacterium]